MYFAQGIPQGLLAIAIPVWLASQGVGAGDIGSLMDRYEFRISLRVWPLQNVNSGVGEIREAN